MTHSDKKRIAKEARDAYRKLRAQRARQAGDLAPPEFDSGAIVDPADGTLNKDVIEAGLGLGVGIPEWAAWGGVPGGEAETAVLQWTMVPNPGDNDFEDVDSQVIVAPAQAGTFPLRLTVPPEKLRPDGPYTLRYIVIGYTDQQTHALPVPIICDNTPPWRNAEPPKLVLPAEPITDDYLIAHPEGVVGTIPDYADRQPGDKVAFWWGVEPLPDDPTQLQPVGIIDVGTPQEVTIPPAVIEATGDGGCYAIYALIDKATNRSRLSVYTKATVGLGPLPDNLLDPVVPQAAKGWIDLQDAFEGVMVDIPEFDNWKPTDRIEVTWGATPLSEETIGSAPLWPLPVRVPTPTLKAEYGTVQGPLTTNVSYRVLRGGMEFGPRAIDVEVDFSVIGPVLPDWPDPTNPNLPLAEIYGAVSNTLNKLTPADNGEDARLTFALYSPLSAGELVEFYWGSQHVAEAQYTVLTGDVPGNSIDRDIPWSYIEAGGNDPAVPVHYRISAPGSPNEQHSPITYVDVGANIITPEAPEVLNISGAGYLICDSLDGPDHAALVQVPDLSQYLADGDQVTLRWTPLAGLTGENELTAAIKEEVITLGGATPVTGFIWRVQPYDVHLLPTYDPGGAGTVGRGRAIYFFDMGGTLITSLQHEVKVAMFDANGSCPIV